MVQLIKKGGLRERANRSRSYQGSENTETTLKPNTYKSAQKKEGLNMPSLSSPTSAEDSDLKEHTQSIKP